MASARTLAKDRNIRAMDIGKRLIDFNFHAPTVYFPLIVPEALMIEPTETENRETLEAFASGPPPDHDRGSEVPPRCTPHNPGQPARRGQGGQDTGAQVDAGVTIPTRLGWKGAERQQVSCRTLDPRSPSTDD